MNEYLTISCFNDDFNISFQYSYIVCSYNICTIVGVLVVNVTWRGKTYVGTLLDATKHDWAPPRY